METNRNPNATKPRLPDLVDIETIAAHLGVDTRHIRRLVSERRIPYLQWGHLLRFDPEEVSVWLDANRVEPARPVVNVRTRR